MSGKGGLCRHIPFSRAINSIIGELNCNGQTKRPLRPVLNS